MEQYTFTQTQRAPGGRGDMRLLPVEETALEANVSFVTGEKLMTSRTIAPITEAEGLTPR